MKKRGNVEMPLRLRKYKRHTKWRIDIWENKKLRVLKTRYDVYARKVEH